MTVQEKDQNQERERERARGLWIEATTSIFGFLCQRLWQATKKSASKGKRNVREKEFDR